MGLPRLSTPHTACNITVVPQNEKDIVLRDCDSDGSDMDYEGETGHLPARLLNAYAEPMQTDHDRNNVISDNEEPTASTHQRVQSEEPRAKLQVRPATAVIPKHIVYSPNTTECVKQSCPNPMDVFLLMYPPTLREITIEMSNLYSTQTKDKQLYLSMDELLTFYGILVTSGYSSVPRRHMYWSLDSDVHNESISDAMRINRPSSHELNQSYKVMPFQEWLSVDESMIRYYGRHGCKQFIRGKPIRFGYKLWRLASSSGYMYHMEPYGGSNTLLPETGLGQGPSVVPGLAEQPQAPQGCKFLHDNLFTSLALLDEMSKRGYGSSGAMSQNRLFDVPFKPQKDFMKLPRGTSEVLTQGDKLLVRWKDNNIVTVITNQLKHMGGVDLHDLQVSRYHISIRSKKWWWPIFAWSLNMAQSLMQKFGPKPLSHRRRSLLAATVEDQARYDKASHWPINTMRRFQRCRHCDKRTTYACEKRKAPLHIECFKIYQGQ
uniref:PiggyBac transposable element-derived protein domain-containing protein n=1 Tax=Salmo trutta TaxID=8032 RepID=A0A674BM32_SALTR